MEHFQPYKFKEPLARTEQQELGKGRKSLAVCSGCGIVYYQKAWHHNADHFKSLIKERKKEKDFALKFIICPACQMIKNHQYEGRIVLKNMPEKVGEELVNLIRNFCERAYQRDPLDRLIALEEKVGLMEVKLTDNQLANRLAHKIKETLHKVKNKIHYAGNPSDVVEIEIVFL